MIDDLVRLSLFVPERHDLALMKIVRGYEHDLQAIWEMHQANAFDLQVLVRRFRAEMTHVVGKREGLRLSFLAAVERLFGREIAVGVESTLDTGS